MLHKSYQKLAASQTKNHQSLANTQTTGSWHQDERHHISVWINTQSMIADQELSAVASVDLRVNVQCLRIVVLLTEMHTVSENMSTVKIGAYSV